jgi:hypothetical protein
LGAGPLKPCRKPNTTKTTPRISDQSRTRSSTTKTPTSMLFFTVAPSTGQDRPLTTTTLHRANTPLSSAYSDQGCLPSAAAAFTHSSDSGCSGSQAT